MRVLKLPEVMNRCALSRSSIYAYIQNNKFPKPVSLGERAVGWLDSEITGCIAERAEQREAK